MERRDGRWRIANRHRDLSGQFIDAPGDPRGEKGEMLGRGAEASGALVHVLRWEFFACLRVQHRKRPAQRPSHRLERWSAEGIREHASREPLHRDHTVTGRGAEPPREPQWGERCAARG